MTTDKPCPTCGKTNFPVWNDKGECITCARDRVLGEGKLPQRNKCFACGRTYENADIHGHTREYHNIAPAQEKPEVGDTVRLRGRDKLTGVVYEHEGRLVFTDNGGSFNDIDSLIAEGEPIEIVELTPPSQSESLDEHLEELRRGNYSKGKIDTIKALIAERERAARIDEVKRLSYWQSARPTLVTPQELAQYTADRLATLTKENVQNDNKKDMLDS